MAEKDRSADGLRGMAAFNVAICHFVSAFLPAILHKNYPSVFSESIEKSAIFNFLTSPAVTLFFNGHFAVVLFFVISGYVLTIPYYAKNEKTVIQKRLWARYLELNIPIAVAIFLSYAAYKFGLYVNIPASEVSGSAWLGNYFKDGISFSSALKEASFASILFGVGTFIPPLWTLKIEFIGSLYLLLFYLVKPTHKTILPMAVVLLFLAANHGNDAIYYTGIFVGSLFNMFRLKRGIVVMSFVLGAYFGAFQFKSVFYEILPSVSFFGISSSADKSIYNTVGAILMTVAVVNGFGRKFFEFRFIQFLGRISYSMYLLHFVILCSLSSFVYLLLPNDNLSLLFNFALYIAVCFMVSSIFEKYIDRRAIDISRRFSEGLLGATVTMFAGLRLRNSIAAHGWRAAFFRAICSAAVASTTSSRRRWTSINQTSAESVPCVGKGPNSQTRRPRTDGSSMPSPDQLMREGHSEALE